MKTNINPSAKPVASLSASLLARKGEAMPAVAATIYNNPSLAWGEPIQKDESINHHAKRIDTSHAPSVFTSGSANEKLQQIKKHLKLSPKQTKENTKVERRAKIDSVALILNIEDENYMRLKYHAQISGKTSQEIIRRAIEEYLDQAGTPTGPEWVIKPLK